MRYPAAETAEKHLRILDEAARLFRDRGFNGAGVAEVMQAAGLSHGSFYNHFASKQALMAECVSHAGAKAIRDVEAAKVENGPVAYVESYLSIAHRDDPGSGCLMSALSADSSRDATVRPSMTRYIQGFIEAMAAHFPWPQKKHPRRDAIRMTSSLVGALILARAVRDEELSEEILREVAEELTQRLNHSRRQDRQI